MRQVTLRGVAIVAFGMGLAQSANASDDDNWWQTLGLQSYEPSAFGYTKTSEDVGFENIKISVKFPLFPKLMYRHFNERDQLYFSFTGSWAFYLGKRHSDPVVGKEYNPQIFWEHHLLSRCIPAGKYAVTRSHQDSKSAVGDCYLTLGYNHDSNGQIISTQSEYEVVRQEHGVAAAEDAISRGWDYIRLGGRFIPYWTASDKFSVYSTFKYFLKDGVLQGPIEELHPWETPVDAKSRASVDGMSVLAKWQRHVGNFDAKLAMSYTTGYRTPFRYSTTRVEAGIVVAELPIVLWAQRGYMNDLAQYYRYVTSYGAQIEIGAF